MVEKTNCDDRHFKASGSRHLGRWSFLGAVVSGSLFVPKSAVVGRAKSAHSWGRLASFQTTSYQIFCLSKVLLSTLTFLPFDFLPFLSVDSDLSVGPIGLVTLLTAKAAGASKVFMTDLMEHRLQKAQELGADGILNVKELKPEEIAAKIVEFFGCEPEVSFECTGASASIETGILVGF